MASGIEKPRGFSRSPYIFKRYKIYRSDIKLFRGDIDFFQFIAKPVNFQLDSILEGYGAT